MKHLILVTTACVCTLAATAGVAGAVVPMQPDTAGGASETMDMNPLIEPGTPLQRTLALLDTGGRISIDLPIEVSRPLSLPAGSYARIYGISPDLAQQIIDSALSEGLDPELGFRLVRVESVFRTRARGPQGALGLTQLMPSTARSVDGSLRTREQILDPATNLRVGFRYLRRMIEKYDGDVRLGLLAYNRGEGTVSRVLRQGRDPENGYSHRVLGTRTEHPYRGTGLVPGGER
jgi:hypothetical protein